jgi:aminotransferase class III
MNEPIELAEGYSAHNYHDGRRYLDMVAAYSAMNFGHRHPRLLQAARAQPERVTLTSRAIYHDRCGPFCKALAELCAMEAVLPMNTGAEAVETAIKTARKWGYEVKRVPPDGLSRPRRWDAPRPSTSDGTPATLAALRAGIKRPIREAGRSGRGGLRFGPAQTNAQRWKEQLRAVRG